jgi:hypothetical protein
MPSGWSNSSTEPFSGWDIIPTQVPYFNERIGQKDSKNTISRDLFGRAMKTRLLKQEIGR